jgi:hypothetical protein
MAQKLEGAIPDGLDLTAGWSLLFTAVDATTGAVVPAVKVSNASLVVTNVGSTPDLELESGPFMLVPGPGA